MAATAAAAAVVAAEGAAVLLPMVRPLAVVVIAPPKLNPVLDTAEVPDRLNPLAVVVVMLPKLKEGVVAGAAVGKLNPALAVDGAPRLNPVPVVVIDEVVAVEAGPNPGQEERGH